MDYDAYVRECERIRADNEQLLAGFEEWLWSQDIASKAVRQHVSNVAFYLNEFLLYDDAIEARSGAPRVGMFLGYWYINKAMGANRAGIEAHAASLGEFYRFMCEQGQISEESLFRLQELVKTRMPDWLAVADEHDAQEADAQGDLWGI